MHRKNGGGVAETVEREREGGIGVRQKDLFLLSARSHGGMVWQRWINMIECLRDQAATG